MCSTEILLNQSRHDITKPLYQFYLTTTIRLLLYTPENPALQTISDYSSKLFEQPQNCLFCAIYTLHKPPKPNQIKKIFYHIEVVPF